jgi:hypothetical protein
MDFAPSGEAVTILFSLVLNCIILLSVMLLNKEGLERIRKILELLSNGGYRDCPHYSDQRKVGRRWYDQNNLTAKNKEKGGGEL